MNHDELILAGHNHYIGRQAFNGNAGCSYQLICSFHGLRRLNLEVLRLEIAHRFLSGSWRGFIGDLLRLRLFMILLRVVEMKEQLVKCVKAVPFGACLGCWHSETHEKDGCGKWGECVFDDKITIKVRCAKVNEKVSTIALGR